MFTKDYYIVNLLFDGLLLRRRKYKKLPPDSFLYL
jgi:hypothetical protein